MRTLLGTVNVYIDYDEKHEPSSCTPVNVANIPLDKWPKEYEVTIRPETDSVVTKGLTALSTEDKIRTILCHELGHFVGFILKDSTQHPLYHAINGALDGERVAWNNAELIAPIDATIKRRCLESYIEGAAKESNDPLLCTLRDIAREIAIDRGMSRWVRKAHCTHATATPWVKEDSGQDEENFYSTLRLHDELYLNAGLAPWKAADETIHAALTDTAKGFAIRMLVPVVLLIVCLACGARAETTTTMESAAPMVLSEVPFFLFTCLAFALGYLLHRYSRAKREAFWNRLFRDYFTNGGDWPTQHARKTSIPSLWNVDREAKPCKGCCTCNAKLRFLQRVHRVSQSKLTHLAVFACVVALMCGLSRYHISEGVTVAAVAAKGVELLGIVLAEKMF